MTDLHYETITPNLKTILDELMFFPEFKPFRLVGGTGLSLHLGHRMSVDIDLFTDADYGSIDLQTLKRRIMQEFTNNEFPASSIIDGMGFSSNIGMFQDDLIKLDIFYNDPFLTAPVIIDNIRLASLEDIAAMKIEAILNRYEKKDFWDIHELLSHFSLNQIIKLHQRRYPYTHSGAQVITRLKKISQADNSIDPICLKGKLWEIIKLEILEEANKPENKSVQ